MRRSSVLLAILAVACGSTASEVTPAAPEPGAPPGASPSAGAPAASAEPGLSGGPVDVVYDLARHLERAEVWRGDTRVVDLGTEAGAKYTLGGWNTGAQTRVVDETTAAIATDTRIVLALPWDGEGDAALTIRARSFRAGPVVAYVGDETIGQADLAGNATWSVLRFTVPASKLRRGENQLALRAAGTGRMPEGGRAGIAVDWVKIGPSAAGHSEDAPPASEAIAIAAGDARGVRVEDGWRLGWALEVPSAARLRGLALSDRTGASLEVTAHRDGAEPVVLGRVTATETGAPIDFDLSSLEGKITRLDLRANGGPVRVLSPAVVTPRSADARELRRPTNVLVYLIDTLRADKLQPYNPESRVRTPGLSRFVERAATLTRAHTQENWTKPSVATLLSGLMPWEHTAVTGESVVPASVALMPELLKERGFYTGSFIANGYVSDRFGFRQGWDTYRNYIRENLRTPAQYVAADVLQWLDRRPEDKPFFLYVHTIDPHVPYRPPSEFVEMYDAGGYRGPVDFSRDATLLENIKLGRIRLGERDKARLAALYDGEITYHDIHFTSIIDGLERRGLADDTMIVITADHGEEFWDHGSVGHGHSVYEELVRVPMFVRLPGVTDGVVRIDEPLGLVDVLPTVLDALGHEIPPDVTGRSFLPLLRGEARGAPRVTVSGFMDGWRTAVVGRYKLIHRSGERFTLYDLDSDPREQNDVAAAHPIAVRYLRGMLGLELARSPASAPATSAPARTREARPRPQHQAQTTEIDPETEAQLRALGYVGSSRR